MMVVRRASTFSTQPLTSDTLKFDHRRQHRQEDCTPAVGAVDSAGPQGTPLAHRWHTAGTPLQNAELVEDEERAQALRLKVAIPDSTVPVAIHRAFGTDR